jgi:hypothetical protein
VSDLSIEERLAAGASVDDLVAAGVLYDDYDPDNDPDYFFTPLRPVEEFTPGPPMPDEEFEARMNKSLRFFKLASEFRKESVRLQAEGVKVGSPRFIVFTEEFKKKAEILRAEKLAEKLAENASDTAL